MLFHIALETHEQWCREEWEKEETEWYERERENDVGGKEGKEEDDDGGVEEGKHAELDVIGESVHIPRITPATEKCPSVSTLATELKKIPSVFSGGEKANRVVVDDLVRDGGRLCASELLAPGLQSARGDAAAPMRSIVGEGVKSERGAASLKKVVRAGAILERGDGDESTSSWSTGIGYFDGPLLRPYSQGKNTYLLSFSSLCC